MPKSRTGFVFEEKGKGYARLDYMDEQGNRKRVRRTQAPYTKTAAKELLKKLIADFDKKGARAYAAEIKTYKCLLTTTSSDTSSRRNTSKGER